MKDPASTTQREQTRQRVAPYGLLCRIGRDPAFDFGPGVTVNAVTPGFVKTDLTGYGTMTPAEGARLPVQYALAGEETGRFVEPGGTTPW